MQPPTALDRSDRLGPPPPRTPRRWPAALWICVVVGCAVAAAVVVAHLAPSIGAAGGCGGG